MGVVTFEGASIDRHTAVKALAGRAAQPASCVRARDYAGAPSHREVEGG